MNSTLLAQITNPVINPKMGEGDVERGATVLGRLVSNLTDGMLLFAFILAFLYLLVGGISWITSGGDKANLESARNKIIHAIVGVIVVASTWAVITLLGTFLGLDIQKLPIPSFGGK